MHLRREDVTWQEVDGHVVVLDLRSSLYLELNPAGSLLWSALLDGAEPDALAQVLVSAYGLDVSAARADTEAFLASLRQQDLLET